MSSLLYEKLTKAQGKFFKDPTEILDDVKTCHEEIIKKYMEPSPLKKSDWLSEITGGEVYLKLESMNPVGSFKVRGALNALTKLRQNSAKNQEKYQSGVANQTEKIKVCAASAGNHAQGVAYAARALGCEAHIFLPKGAPLVKRNATEKLGAKIYLVGDKLEDAFEAALDFSEKETAHFVHAYNDFDIIIGQATCAYELLHQFYKIKTANDLNNNYEELQRISPDYFLCSIGGGGLVAGTGLVFNALKTKTKVIGVEQELYNSALRSFQSKTHIPSETHSKSKSTIADGIAVGFIGNLNYDHMMRTIEKVTTVDDDFIAKSILGLCEQDHIISEGAGAAAVAEILKRPCFYSGKTVVACVSGGNIDPQLLTRVITRGLHITDRVLKICVCVSDKPGGLRQLLHCVAEMGGNVLDLVHDRTYSAVSIGDVDVELSLETRNSEHQYALVEKLEEAGFKPRIRH